MHRGTNLFNSFPKFKGAYAFSVDAFIGINPRTIVKIPSQKGLSNKLNYNCILVFDALVEYNLVAENNSKNYYKAMLRLV